MDRPTKKRYNKADRKYLRMYVRKEKGNMELYNSLYTFLMYLQMANIFLTFIMLVVGIVGSIFAIRALLIYIKKNKPETVVVPSLAVKEAEVTEAEEAVQEEETVEVASEDMDGKDQTEAKEE